MSCHEGGSCQRLSLYHTHALSLFLNLSLSLSYNSNHSDAVRYKQVFQKGVFKKLYFTYILTATEPVMPCKITKLNYFGGSIAKWLAYFQTHLLQVQITAVEFLKKFHCCCINWQHTAYPLDSKSLIKQIKPILI